jgi:aspartate/glutamate racemase
VKTLGIIGGGTPASRIEYYRQMVAACRQRTGDGSDPPLLIDGIDMKNMLGLDLGNWAPPRG